MRKQVQAYVKPAREVEGGDRILTARMTVAKVTSTELFTDASTRACVEVRFADCGRRAAMTFVAADEVLVLE
jgi:hypothetical protein